MKQIGLYPVKSSEHSIAERIHLCRRFGFDYICASSIAQLTETGADSFVSCAEREGLPIDNVHLTGSRTTAIWFEGSEGDDIVSRYQKEMSLAMERGVTQGVMHITWGFTPVTYAPIGMERLRRLIDHAERIGFTVGMENSAYPALFHVAFDELTSPCARFTFDSGHWNAFFSHDDPIYETHGDRMIITHLADNEGVRDLHMIPLDGTTDFALLAPHLRRMERLTFEVAGRVCKPHKTTRQAAERDMAATTAYAQGLVRVDDENIYVYEGLRYEQYLERLMTHALRLRDMIEGAEAEKTATATKG